MKNRELKVLLQRYGYIHVRSRGDHHIFKREGESRPIVLFGDNGTEAPDWQVRRVKRRKTHE
jgi:predicted RNA binding protein YcfA (HicA-like mRNA interferase family)